MRLIFIFFYKFNFKAIYLLVILLSIFTGCSITNTRNKNFQKIYYRSNNIYSLNHFLAKPPNLIELSNKNKVFRIKNKIILSIKDYENQKNIEQYNRHQDKLTILNTNYTELKHDGIYRWLLIRNINKNQLWKLLEVFWQEQGFTLIQNLLKEGIMQTNCISLPRQFQQQNKHNKLYQMIARIFDRKIICTSTEQNYYRTRIESTLNGDLYVFITQKKIYEQVYKNTITNSTTLIQLYQPSDINYEIEFLQKLSQKILQLKIKNEVQIGGTNIKKDNRNYTTLINKTILPDNKNNNFKKVIKVINHQIFLSQTYNQAWLTIGKALNDANFTISNIDQEHGIYFINYVDPNDLSAFKQSFWNQMLHGKKEKQVIKYQLSVKLLTPTKSVVVFTDINNKEIHSIQTDNILDILKNYI